MSEQFPEGAPVEAPPVEVAPPVVDVVPVDGVGSPEQGYDYRPDEGLHGNADY